VLVPPWPSVTEPPVTVPRVVVLRPLSEVVGVPSVVVLVPVETAPTTAVVATVPLDEPSDAVLPAAAPALVLIVPVQLFPVQQQAT
jgi:hypothetical protein